MVIVLLLKKGGGVVDSRKRYQHRFLGWRLGRKVTDFIISRGGKSYDPDTIRTADEIGEIVREKIILSYQVNGVESRGCNSSNIEYIGYDIETPKEDYIDYNKSLGSGGWNVLVVKNQSTSNKCLNEGSIWRERFGGVWETLLIND